MNHRNGLELLDFDDVRRMWHKDVAQAYLRTPTADRLSEVDTCDIRPMTATTKTRIFNRFLWFVLPFVILSITVTGVVLTWINYNHFRQTITVDYRNILRSSAGEIGTFMSHGKDDLQALARILAAIKPDDWQQEIALSAFHFQHERYLSVTLISQDGTTLASTQWQGDGAIPGMQPLFLAAMDGRSSVSSVQLTAEQLPYVLIAVPVMAKGKVQSVLFAALDLKHVWDVLEGITIGKSGQVYIMDLSGRYLAHRRIDKVLTQPPKEVPDILDKIRRSEAPVSWLEKSDGTVFYCLGTLVPSLDWIVALRQPTREIYYYLFRNILWAAGITVAACLCAMLLGWYRIKAFLRPIHSLHRQVGQIASGDLSHRVSITTGDEIGELGHAFNDMTSALKEKIAEEIETARQLAHAQDLAVLGASASKVTHEVGNLLNNVEMTANAIKSESLSTEGDKALEELQRESKRLRGFIQSFLQFAKPSELRLQTTRLDLLIREAVAMHAPSARTRDIKIEVAWPDDTPKLPVDVTLAYQMFNNLIKNGIEAMGQSGVLRISATYNRKRVEINIEDSGPGIAEPDLDRIFQPFFTTKGKAGTGLGLAIVKSTCIAHRGTISCESIVGKGTTFRISLPIR